MSYAKGDRVWWWHTAATMRRGTVAVVDDGVGVRADDDGEIVYNIAGLRRENESPLPGFYPGLSDADYHSFTGSLSASGAKLLLPPSVPAKFRQVMDGPPKPKREYDFGHAAHKFILGEGEEIVPVYADDWRTKTAREQRDCVRAENRVPLLATEVNKAIAVADAVAEHPTAGPLLAAEGQSEVSLFTTDPDTGVALRARPDRMTEHNGRLMILDVKTTASAEPDEFEKAAARYFYHLQAALYRHVAMLLGLSDDPAFLFVCVEKEPPYLVNTFEFDPPSMAEGHRQMRRAIEVFAECSETGVWPGYPVGITPISLPGWAYSAPETIEGLASP